VGLRLASSPRRALLAYLLGRARLRLRGLGCRLRDSGEVGAEQCALIDVCWSVAIGLGYVDTIRGADFQTRHLILALEAGEPYRLARALAIEAAYSSVGGGSSKRRTADLLRRAQEVAESLQHPHALGLVGVAKGMAACLEGRYEDALTFTGEAATILRDRCVGTTWELFNAEMYRLLALTYLGRLRELRDRAMRSRHEAVGRGDVYALTNLSARILHTVHLVEGNPAIARQESLSAMQRWSRDGMHLQHYFGLFSQTEINLFVGDDAAALELVKESRARLERSLLLRIEHTRLEYLFLRARAYLASAQRQRQRPAARKLLQEVRSDARRLAACSGWAMPLAELLLGGVAAVTNDREQASRHLARALDGFERRCMALHAAVAKRRLAEISSGEDGKRLVAEADSYFASQGVRDSESMARMMAPWSLVEA
ncbi:MAG: serine/threonine-protein kinase PknK, partial [Pseudomonadota bacterium]